MSVADSLTVASAGVDTWSPGWYVESKALDAALYSVATIDGPGGSRLVPDSIAGYRVGYFPGNSLFFAEGHPGGEELVPGAELAPALGVLEIALSDYGLRMGGSRFAGVRRIDSTADLRFGDRLDGMATMAALAAIQYPRCKTVIHRETGGSKVETVLIKGRAGRRTLGRMYDKGIESGTALPGEWTRFEDQKRMSKDKRWGLTDLTGVRVHESFKTRFLPLYQATKGVTVAGPPIIGEVLAKKIEAGEVTPQEAIRIAGYVMLESTGADLGSTRTQYRRRAEARAAGIYSDPNVCEELASVEVSVSDVLEAALDSPAWGIG